MDNSKIMFKFPILKPCPNDTGHVVQDSENKRRILVDFGGGVKELTRKELLEKIGEYEEAVAMTKTALALLR